jgi:hypothetical protein
MATAKSKTTQPKAETPAAEPVERETYTAKQIATRIGTDPKVLRKFFRDPASTVEPCGQGGRYEFAAEDLPKIKAEFEAYQSGKKPRGRQPSEGGTTKSTKGRQAPAAATVIAEDEELLDLDDLELDDEEPSDLDLDEIDEGLEEEDDVEEVDDEVDDDEELDEVEDDDIEEED